MKNNKIFDILEKQLNCSLNHMKELECLEKNGISDEIYKTILTALSDHIVKCKDILKLKNDSSLK